MRREPFYWAAGFCALFAFYLGSVAPHVAAYRDAGEMVSLLSVLGVAHPPGYPLYTLSGNIFEMLPFATAAYRANAFSALWAALAVLMLIRVMREWVGVIPAVLSMIAFAVSPLFWELAAVSEMYTMGVFWFGLILYAACVRKNSALTFFVYAVGLGVRMDLLLLMPLFVLWFWFGVKDRRPFTPGIFFAAGLTLFLYLRVRSKTDPVLDWGNPDTLAAVFNSMSRKSYSGTLDLLSLSYKTGENFWVDLELYVTSLGQSFGLLLLVLIPGVLFLYRSDRSKAFLLFALFLLSGPVFLFLANMPPNPHAVAIIEASFLIPHLMVSIFIGFGLRALGERRKAVWISMAVVAIAIQGVWASARALKRQQFTMVDYVNNVFRSAPRNAVLVFHKDVQLFSLWQAQMVEGRRKDISLLATGLSGSEWYWEMIRRWNVAGLDRINLKDETGWKQLWALSRPSFAGYETDIPNDPAIRLEGHGFLMKFADATQPQQKSFAEILKHIALYRGGLRYDTTPDFFISDLVGDAGRAHHREALARLNLNDIEGAQWYLRRASRLDPATARYVSDLGYLYLKENNLPRAEKTQRHAAALYEKMLKLTAVYRSLPELIGSVRRDLASSYLNLGATLERQGKLEEARTYYRLSATTDGNAQAYYNIAVTYWGRDWSEVINNLNQALKINSQFSEAQHYLTIAVQKQKQGAAR